MYKELALMAFKTICNLLVVTEYRTQGPTSWSVETGEDHLNENVEGRQWGCKESQ